MTVMTGVQPTLIAALWPTNTNGMLRAAALALLGSALLTVSAKVQVPFWPVPMTLQTLALQLIAMSFGLRLGVATVLLYLAEGALGLPVFAGSPERGIGLAYIVGPTGGYLAGFVVATAAMGWLAERGWDRSVLRAFAVGLVGNAIVIGLGSAWLASLIGLERALAAGVTPFLLASFLKVGLAAAIMPAAWQLIRR